MPWITKRKIAVRANKHEVNERRNDKWNRYYGDKRWKELRNWYIREHPLCESCLFNGRSVPAEHVHHKHPFGDGITDEEKFKLLLDPENLQSLCQACHRKIHAELKNKK